MGPVLPRPMSAHCVLSLQLAGCGLHSCDEHTLPPVPGQQRCEAWAPNTCWSERRCSFGLRAFVCAVLLGEAYFDFSVFDPQKLISPRFFFFDSTEL
jgi:hypothetical protein